MHIEEYFVLIPLVIYLSITYLIALWARVHQKNIQKPDVFIEEYFIGSRSMGGFVLAMSLITSYTSASSFIGGPGAAYEFGLSWVLLAMIQVPVVFLTLGVLGKRFAYIARKIKAVTLIDVIRIRYQSDVLIILCSTGLLIFFIAAMLAQFIGGARLFQSITGFSYNIGLMLFGLTVIIYTTIGGFRAVVLTDVLQGFVMLSSSIIILFVVIYAAGGVKNCITKLYDIDPALITPTGPNGFVSKSMAFSFWILVGLGVIGLPQTAQKCMAYKNSYSMHKAMVLGTIIIGVMLLNMHLAGAFGRAILPDLAVGDFVIPSLIVKLLPPVWAGIFIAGPLAAIMSTVDAMLLLASAVIVKDLYIHYRLKEKTSAISQKCIKCIGASCTVIIGVIVFILALHPPALLIWINLFAFGGLEVIFLWPIIFGIYWKKANAQGAIYAIIVGISIFFGISIFDFSFGNIHAIVPALFLSGIAFMAGSYYGKAPSKAILSIFWEDI